MKNEPLVTVASLTSLLVAVLALLVAFGAPLDEEQQTAILGVAAVVAPLVVAAVARAQVTPSANVVEQVQGTDVVAGEASELPTGQYVREAGSLTVDDDPDTDAYVPEHAVEGDA